MSDHMDKSIHIQIDNSDMEFQKAMTDEHNKREIQHIFAKLPKDKQKETLLSLTEIFLEIEGNENDKS